MISTNIDSILFFFDRFLLYQILVIVRFTNVSMKYRKVKIDDPTLRGSHTNHNTKLNGITIEHL